MDTKKLRQKILDLAIHGKLVPQDPNDEPASVLLERIRAEKDRLIAEGKIKRSKKSATSDTPHYENVPFEVPEGWCWTTLQDISLLIEDCPHTTAPDEGSGYPLVRTPNIGEGYLILEGVHRVSEEIYNKRNVRAVPQTDDIVYAREAPAGNAAVIKKKEKICLGQRTVLIRPAKNYVDSNLLAYFILSPYSRNRLISKATGSTVQHVNMESIRPHLIPLPPYNEQLRIVDKIKDLLSLVDELAESEITIYHAVDQAKSKILDLAIHGKLVPQDDHDEPASELLKRINPKAVASCDNPQYGKVPSGWVWCKIEDIFKVVMGQSPNGDSVNHKFFGVEFHQGKLFFSQCVVEKSDVYTTSPTKLADKDSLLVCVRAPVGDVNITDREICIGRGLCALKPLSNLPLDYWFYAIKSLKAEFNKKATGSTFLAISALTIKNQVISLPPYKEQLRIVSKVNELFSQLDMIEKSLQA